MNTSSKIYVAGHNGMVGSVIVRSLLYTVILYIIYRSSKELDLCNQSAVEQFFATELPEHAFSGSERELVVLLLIILTEPTLSFKTCLSSVM